LIDLCSYVIHGIYVSRDFIVIVDYIRNCYFHMRYLIKNKFADTRIKHNINQTTKTGVPWAEIYSETEQQDQSQWQRNDCRIVIDCAVPFRCKFPLMGRRPKGTVPYAYRCTRIFAYRKIRRISDNPPFYISDNYVPWINLQADLKKQFYDPLIQLRFRCMEYKEKLWHM